MNKEIPAFAGMAALFIFADNTEFGGIQKYKKPPFRRKPESHSREIKGKRPSHSCESRNLRRRKAAGN
ncbi:MAG: hypothetical protein ACR2QC_00570 [Gammaproteobacteria bacterium]